MTITHPTALADQHQAAEAETARNLADFAAFSGGTVAPMPTSAWLRGHIARLYAALAEGTAEVCEHLPQGPRPMFAALWRPETVVCDQCTLALLLGTSTAAEHTCDRCQAESDHIASTAIATGPLIIAYGLCPTCAATDTAPRTRTRRRPRRTRTGR